ncbi:acyl-CoA thioesterase [Aquabacterium humicola]|uniref:acyl-CoA thioesterase n=1 Tax=Aquabacterium humicola TaxID=3237377 RepID=UPI002543279C|nr:thioesterase family protein [Rubrivivax pictus]
MQTPAIESTLGYRGAVYPWHCDHMGHMNVMWYVGKFDEALWNYLARLGLTPAYLREQRRGMAAVEQTIRYQRELLAGDTIGVRVHIVELRDKALVVELTMFNEVAGHAAATMRLTAVHLDTTQRRAVAFEAAIADALRAQLQPAVEPA